MPQGTDLNRTQVGAPPLATPSDGSGTLALVARPGNTLAYSAERTRNHIMTQIVAQGGTVAGGGKRMPVNIALVVDRSGSMEGEPLDYVKRACAFVVDMLTPDDVLSIVTFEETVEVIMPARRVTDPNLVKQHIARITAGNTTNLFDGLYAAGAQVASVPIDGYVNRVLLLTDGEPTAGLKDFASIVNQVAELKTRGVTVTALGFGPEYNEELMAGIARRSGGNYYYIAKPEEIPDVFRKEVEQVLGTVARNARLTLHLPRGVNVRNVYGTQAAFGQRAAEIVLGDVEKGSVITKIWELDYEPRRSGEFRVAKAVLTWDDSAKGLVETASANAIVEFISDAKGVIAGADPAVGQELSVLMATRDLEKTMMGMRTQQLSATDLTQALERTRQLLTQQGRTEQAQEVAQVTQAVQRGDSGALEKTLIGTIYSLDQGRRK